MKKRNFFENIWFEIKNFGKPKSRHFIYEPYIVDSKNPIIINCWNYDDSDQSLPGHVFSYNTGEGAGRASCCTNVLIGLDGHMYQNSIWHMLAIMIGMELYRRKVKLKRTGSFRDKLNRPLIVR